MKMSIGLCMLQCLLLLLCLSSDSIVVKEKKVVADAQAVSTPESSKIQVFHYVHPRFTIGPPFIGKAENCTKLRSGTTCTFQSSSNLDELSLRVKEYLQTSSHHPSSISVSLYNFETMLQNSSSKPTLIEPHCQKLPTLLTMIESDGSYPDPTDFQAVADRFDGTSFLSSLSTLRRYNKQAYLNPALFLHRNHSHLRPFKSLLKASAYVSSHCLKPGPGGLFKRNSARDNVVKMMRQRGLQVDGLSKCLRSKNLPRQSILAGKTNDTFSDLIEKRKMISNYLFYLAFENQIEPWYVSHLVFDALYAGFVPIYLGDALACKALLPHPQAAIFLQDFGTTNAFISYLETLMHDEKAYEKHRMWRRKYDLADPESYTQKHSLLKESWPCSVCAWAQKWATAKGRVKKSKIYFKCAMLE